MSLDLSSVDKSGQPQQLAPARAFCPPGLSESTTCDISQTGPAPIVLVLPYPPSTNRYWRHRSMPGGGIQTYVSKDGKEFRESVAALARVSGLRTPLAGRVALDYTLYPHRPQDWKTRQRKLGDGWQDTVQCIDLDNAQKALLDALTGVAFEDDAWVREIHARRAEPDGESRLVVRITPIATAQPQGALL